MPYPELRSRVAIVTGAAGGIGSAVVRRLAAEGMRVLAVDRAADAVARVARETDPSGENVHAFAADTTNETEVAAYVAEALARFGTIDAFFNNAGIVGTMTPLVDLSEEEFRRVIDVNLVGSFLGLKHVLPVLYAKGRGAVVNTSSIAGLESTLGTAAYDSSKHGVAGLTKVAALESSARGVRVNSIHPGPVDTGMMTEIRRQRNPADPDADGRRMAAAIPLGRPAEADEISNLVTFLLSDEAGYITGATYRIDGGMGAAARLAVIPRS
ncbi:glucose 1-dehydrogenase [Microbacterium sp. SYP-A9085]|jgi:NAD(P)-dependent dehydrogenase (short-subunit alcohol dehydrogenase family)|uniref:SDR family NAD(P)-dependent oxidoreductase n=1 Tax=Microbacterium sp. SYP-A9085 TaxID=2664454 RepID=UPI00129A618E|nr:SDR family NAD(P)-dependent oxidoreductase [Microbacterium sp. SYP-A9085]MRH28050.1 glucose 1-dehydrogenase [Microbacterium sp. SYP-A9085]